jgi:hypothetical protein
MNSKLVSVVAAVAMIGGVSPMSAAIMDVTYTGTVRGQAVGDETRSLQQPPGIDTLGIFGTAGANLVGSSWVATYTFDTSHGTYYSTGDQSYVIGGSAFGSISPVLSSMITINGVSKSVDGSYAGYEYGLNTSFGYSAQFQEAISLTQDKLVASIFNYNGSLPASITTPFTHTLDINDTVNNGMYSTANDTETFFANISILTVSFHEDDGDSGDHDEDHEHVHGVPEPSTWAMILLGFAGIGFAAYRKKKTGTFAMAAA